MQESEGKPSRKSDKIASTPTRGQTAEVTPRLNATEREQANTKKAKHTKKKGLENYFGTGVRMPPPSLAGTPIDAAGKRRGGVHKEGKDKRTPQSGANSDTRNKGEDNQRGESAGSTRKSSKKSPPKGSDDEHSRRSKKTQSDDDASSPDESGGGKSANLESIKGLLRRKGTGTPSSKESKGTGTLSSKEPKKKDKKKATFAEAVAKGTTTKKKAPKITHKKCVVAFSV